MMRDTRKPFQLDEAVDQLSSSRSTSRETSYHFSNVSTDTQRAPPKSVRLTTLTSLIEGFSIRSIRRSARRSKVAKSETVGLSQRWLMYMPSGLWSRRTMARSSGSTHILSWRAHLLAALPFATSLAGSTASILAWTSQQCNSGAPKTTLVAVLSSQLMPPLSHTIFRYEAWKF